MPETNEELYAATYAPSVDTGEGADGVEDLDDSLLVTPGSIEEDNGKGDWNEGFKDPNARSTKK